MSRGVYIVLLISCVLGAESVPLDSSLGIVGGRSVNITDAPFMARITMGFRPFDCGATIVHDQFLITSGACYYGIRRFSHRQFVILGTDDAHTGGEAYDVEKGFLHPEFDPNELDYDVAVVKVAKPLTFSESVKPIALADMDVTVPKDAMFDIFGFGSVSASVFDIELSDKLQKASVAHLESDKCKAAFLPLTDRMICARTEWRGSCYGDDGGPLVYNNKLLGVTTDGLGCGSKTYPTIYTYIPAVRDFIESIIDKNA